MDKMPTCLRTSAATVFRQARLISQAMEVSTFLDAIPDVLLVVNSTRQIVFGNKAAVNFFGVSQVTELLGRRPGEAAHCQHSEETPGGCGNSEACRVCGAFQAICSALSGDSPVEECRMLTSSGTSLDLRVWARLFRFSGESFVILSIQDISDEKRRQILEKLFFHDILNTAGGLKSLGEIMESSGPEELHELSSLVSTLSGQLLDEIHAQREILSAERGELVVRDAWVRSPSIIERVIATYRKHPICEGRFLERNAVCEDIPLKTDSALVARVLGNLVKNALEASPVGYRVEVGCRLERQGGVEFFVHNHGVISEQDQLQIFKRSFSTKGNGRGIGTYSVKLLTEQFLKGSVGFVSDNEEQTRFFVRVPQDSVDTRKFESFSE